MSVLELKGNLLQLLARLDNEKSLTALYESAKRFVKEEEIMDYEKEVDGWQDLSKEQQANLKMAIEESNDPKNLVPHEDVLKMMDAWVK
jgi:hypothetical protein